VKDKIEKLESSKNEEVLEGLRFLVNSDLSGLSKDQAIQIWCLINERILVRSDNIQIKMLGKALQGKIVEQFSDIIKYISDDGRDAPPQTKKQEKQEKQEKKENEKFCSECGAIIFQKAEICPKCGCRQVTIESVISRNTGGKDRKIAAALAIVFGNIGAHKFYLGNMTMGIVYIIFCLTFIPAIIGIIEGIIYLSKTDEEFKAEYVNSNQ